MVKKQRNCRAVSCRYYGTVHEGKHTVVPFGPKMKPCIMVDDMYDSVEARVKLGNELQKPTPAYLSSPKFRVFSGCIQLLETISYAPKAQQAVLTALLGYYTNTEVSK